jgi:hypothetical protein
MEDLLEHSLQVLDDGVLEVLILPRLEDVELFLDGAGNLLEVLLRHVQLPLSLRYLGPGPKTAFERNRETKDMIVRKKNL